MHMFDLTACNDHANPLWMAFYILRSPMLTSQVIASKLTQSKVEIPHFYLTMDCAVAKMKEMVKGIHQP